MAEPAVPPRHRPPVGASLATQPITKPPTAQADGTPTAKVTAFTLGGSAVTILTFILSEFNYDLPGGVGAALATWIGFGIAYWKKSRPGELDV